MKNIKISPKAARINAEISQKDAAKAFGIDVSTLRRYENGVAVPPWDIADAMSILYKMDKDFIFFKSNIALGD